MIITIEAEDIEEAIAILQDHEEDEELLEGDIVTTEWGQIEY